MTGADNRDQRSEIRGQRSGVRGQGSEVRDRRPEVRELIADGSLRYIGEDAFLPTEVEGAELRESCQLLVVGLSVDTAKNFILQSDK